MKIHNIGWRKIGIVMRIPRRSTNKIDVEKTVKKNQNFKILNWWVSHHVGYGLLTDVVCASTTSVLGVQPTSCSLW